jgi:hypothetical protein
MFFYSIIWTLHLYLRKIARMTQRLELQRKDLMIRTGWSPNVGRIPVVVYRMKPMTQGSVWQQVWHVKEPSLLKAISAEHRPRFAG